MWGVGVNTSVSTNNQESSVYNDTQIYNDNAVKETLINNYITNITTRTENVNEIVKNFQNNVSAEADSIQKNTAKFAACMDMPDANIVQSNELVQNVSQGFEQLYEDAKVLKSVIESTSDTQSTIDQGLKSSQTTDATSEQKATQDQENKQTTKQETFTLLNKYNSVLREKFIYGNKNATENFSLFGNRKKTDSRYFVNSSTCAGFVNYIEDAFGQKQMYLFGSNKNNTKMSDKISSQYQPLVEFVLNNYVNKKSEKFFLYAGNVLAYPKDKNDEQCRNFINFVRNRFSDGITRSDGALKVGTQYNALIGFTLDKYVNKTTKQESFRQKTKLGPREYFRSLLYRHEPFCLFGCVDINTSVSTNSQKSSAVNKSLQQNINTQDIYQKIDTAYDKVVDTINKMSETVNQTTNSLAGASSIQINELSFEDPADVCKMNLAGLNLEQKNKLEQNVELTTAIENINSMTQDNEVRAIMSDMMGLTQTTDTTQAATSSTKQTSEQTQKSTQETTQTAGGSWIMIVVIVVVVGLVGFMLFKAGSSKDGYFDASPIKKLTQKANKLGVNKSLNKMGVKNPMSKGIKNPMGKNANKPPKSSNKASNKPKEKPANNNNVTTVSTGDAVVMSSSSSTSTGDANNNSLEVPEGQAIQA